MRELSDDLSAPERAGVYVQVNAYTNWSTAALLRHSYMFGWDVVVAGMGSVAIAVGKAYPWYGIPFTFLFALTTSRGMRLAGWALARRPWEPRLSAPNAILALFGSALIGLFSVVPQNRDANNWTLAAASCFTIIYTAATAAIVVGIWRRLSRNTTIDGRKFLLFGIAVVATMVTSVLSYRSTVPADVPPNALDSNGGLALFVTRANADVTFLVSLEVTDGEIVDDEAHVEVYFSSDQADWAIQASGGWLAKSVKPASAKVELLDKTSMFITNDQFGQNLPDDQPDSTTLILPTSQDSDSDSNGNYLSVSWISTGDKQVLSGHGDAAFDLVLRSDIVYRGGGASSVATAGIGCVEGLTETLASAYPVSKSLPASVMHLNGLQYYVPKRCDVTLGTLRNASDLFPVYTSTPTNASDNLGWNRVSRTDTLIEARRKRLAALDKNHDGVPDKLDFSLPATGAGTLSIGSRQLRLVSAHEAGQETARQALAVGLLGTALGASVLVLDLLLSKGWRGLFSQEETPVALMRRWRYLQLQADKARATTQAAEKSDADSGTDSLPEGVTPSSTGPALALGLGSAAIGIAAAVMILRPVKRLLGRRSAGR